MTETDQFAEPAPKLAHRKKLSPASRFKSAWADSTALKLTIIGGSGLCLLLTGVVLFSGSKNTNNSNVHVSSIPELTANPDKPSTQAYQQQVSDYNKQRRMDAEANGGSNLDTPEIPTDRSADRQGDDALSRYAAAAKPAEVPAASFQNATPAQTGQKPDAPPQISQEEQNAIKAELATLEGSWKLKGPTSVYGDTEDADATQAAKSSAEKTAARAETILEKAGTVRYAKTKFETDSDAVGTPVAVDILAGALTGAVATGTFQLAQEKMVMKFDTATLNGVTYQIDAIAVDPNTNRYTLADSVDHHYLERIILPAAAAFISGFGSAASTPATTIETNGSSTVSQQTALNTRQELLAGAGAAATQTSNIINAAASQLHDTTIVYANRPIGLFFLKNVTAPEENHS